MSVGLIARGGGFRWGQFENSADVAFDRLIETGEITEGQLAEAAFETDIDSLRASVVGVYAMGVFCGLLVIAWLFRIPLPTWPTGAPDWELASSSWLFTSLSWESPSLFIVPGAHDREIRGPCLSRRRR